MKKNIIVSLIVALMLVILPNSVKALNYKGIELPDLPTGYGDYYTIAYNENNNIRLVFYSNSLLQTINGVFPTVITGSYNNSSSSTGITNVGGYGNSNVYIFKLENNQWKYIGYDCYSLNLADSVTYVPLINTYEENGSVEELKQIFDNKIIYSNVYFSVNFKAWTGVDNDLVSLYVPEEYRAKITLTKAASCDLDGIDIYHIEADFSSVVDTELIYQVKIGDNDWIDITEQINDHETYGYKYQYSAYYNLEFKARVLYQDGTVKTENSIFVTELSSFSLQNYKKYAFTGNYKYALIRSETMTNSNVDFIIDSNYVDRKNSKTELLEVDYFNKEARFCYVYNDINLVGNYYRSSLKVDEYNYIFPVIVRQNINELITFYIPHGYYVIFSNEDGSEISVDGTDKEIDFDNIDIAYLNSLISDFMNKNNNAVSLVRNIFSIFFDDMPEEIYQSVVVVLFVIFIGVILAVVGWK